MSLDIPIQIEACLFNPTFYKRSHSKGPKKRALPAHQTKTKDFIAKLFAPPIDLQVIFSICMDIPLGIKGQFTHPVVVDGPKLDES